MHLLPYLVIEVGTIKGRFKNSCIKHAKVFLNIVLDLGRGSCSKSYDRCNPHFIYDRPDPPVFRPEVMPPLRNTVRLINGIKRDSDLPQELDILILCK